jgi:hypothetical protein
MVVQSGTEPKDTMREVRSGAYSVENSVVAYSDTHFTYWTASGKPWSGFADASTPQLLRINGDSLQLTPTNILTRLTSTGSVSQLAGTWRSVEWRLMIRADSLYPKLESRLEIVCTFGQDSSTYGETWQYLDLPQHPVETYHGTYRYSPPNLEIRKGDTTSVRVAIVFSKMYWFHDEWSRRLIRIK